MPNLPPVSLLAPLVLLAVAGIGFVRSGRRPGRLPRLAEVATLAAFAFAGAGLVQLLLSGPARLTFGEVIPLSFRLDALAATMTVLVAFVGWMVVRYARSYIDGEAREGLFHGLMLATLAAVLLLVQAGSLTVLVPAFLAVGLGLHGLLRFYADRPEARRAAMKFALIWGAGDLALVAATALLWLSAGTPDIATINAAAATGATPALQVAAALLALTALLKTAAFPLHGWLTEVMEAPTPVSALLHAGIINAGGFLLIRLSDLVQASPGVMAALVFMGGLTALFGAVVMLTQSAVKTALAWSTVAQMGFMLLQCGLGLWALALLHIVAHSLYKAHAFLAAGTAVKAVNAIRRPGPVAVPGLAAVGKSFALAVLLYAMVAAVFGLLAAPKSAQAVALGTILIFGVAYLVAQGLADAAPLALTQRTAAASLAAAVGYFAFHLGADAIWGPHLPVPPQAGPLEWALIVLAVATFGLVAVAQTLFPHWAHHPATAGLRVHVANGLYLNAVLDRMIGGFRTAKPL